MDFSTSEIQTLDTGAMSFYTVEEDMNLTTVKPAFLPCSHRDVVDKATADTVEQIFNLTVLPLLELFGVTTNVINCVVFARQGLKDRINLCLFSLALADMGFLVSMFAAKSFSFLGLFDEGLEQYWNERHLGILLSPLMGMMTISNLMTLIISLERCICVMSPFKAKTFLKTRYMAILIVTMSIYILAIYSLLNMKYVMVRVTNPVTNTTNMTAGRWNTRLSDFYLNNRLVIDVFYNYLLTLTVSTLSLAVMIVATSVTVVRLKSSLAWRQESVDTKTALGDRREAAVTKMMTVICFIYIATITPSVTHAFVRALFPGYTVAGKYCNIYTILQTLSYTFEVTNSSVNFIVYVTMGSRYRQTLRELTCRASRTTTVSVTSSQRM